MSSKHRGSHEGELRLYTGDALFEHRVAIESALREHERDFFSSKRRIISTMSRTRTLKAPVRRTRKPSTERINRSATIAVRWLSAWPSMKSAYH
ncbi:MAG: hypothetical protein ACI957_001083, partial [Verrucomicrobiales bacterium]